MNARSAAALLLTRPLLALLLLIPAACGSTGSVTVGHDDTVDATPPDSVLDSAGQDLGADELALDLPAPPEEVLDLPPETTEPQCQPGEGCFLDPCETNEDCLSNWCVNHLGDQVCTQTCQQECPPGWSCQQVSAALPDLVYVCISEFANLCRPCATGADCKTLGGTETVCVDYGAEGSFCGGECEQDEDCPWGFDCTDTVTVVGVETRQCVAAAGVCPCTDTAIALGLSTPCEKSNDTGTCTGLRICTEEGLSDCDAPDPTAEQCNGLDDDCDGEVDEPELLDGEYVPLCRDDNPCTDDQCLGEEGCVNTPLLEGECTDGNPCTVADHCDEGTCVGEGVDCDDGNPCTADLCTETGGCTHEPAPGECDDGDPCTLGDHCQDGSCTGEPVDCTCQVDEDCLSLEDGDLCNGSLYCDTESLPYQCQVIPETVIACPLPEGLDAPCLVPTCDPETGACSFAPANDGLPCNDGDSCTAFDTCQEGLCIGGPAVNCNDGNPCTDDGCQPETGCTHDPNTAPCNDGDVCTTSDQCADGSCAGGAPLVCDDGNPCTNDSCDPLAGCQFAANTAPCDDGNACTAGDTCSGGACLPGAPVFCDDGDVCTTDSCHPLDGCQYVLNSAPCDDGDLCTTGDTCIQGTCLGTGTLTCVDNNPCTTDGCAPDGGCTFTPTAGDCDDGNACTIGDLCVDGTCLGQESTDCDDGNPCTTDTCQPATGCLHEEAPGPCDDGDPCTVGDTCIDGLCAAGLPLNCDDGNPCTIGTCDPMAGCQYEPGPGPCDDGNACTADDFCDAGECVPGTPVLCDDANVCTDDTCAPQTGCVHTANNLPCDDGDACTTDDICADGTCTGPVSLLCDDGDACTEDSCDPATGCLFAPISPCCGNGQVEAGEVCDDGNTVGDDGCEADCLAHSPLLVNFTTCGLVTGRTGPTQQQCDAAYADQPDLVAKVLVQAGLQFWSAPYTGTYRFIAAGASTTSADANGGYGALIQGDIDLAAGQQIKILVGQRSTCPSGYCGGGGGTFVATADDTPLIVAGGGGGRDERYGTCASQHANAGTDGNATCNCSSPYAPGTNGNGGAGGSGGGGGGGFFTNGGYTNGGLAFVNGGTGGDGAYGDGGFGGGAGTDDDQGAGAGGYSGGGGCGENGNSGGGGSFNSGANPDNQGGQNSGVGYVTIEYLG